MVSQTDPHHYETGLIACPPSHTLAASDLRTNQARRRHHSILMIERGGVSWGVRRVKMSIEVIESRKGQGTMSRSHNGGGSVD